MSRIDHRCNKKGQSRYTGITWYTRRRKTKQTQNPLCVGQQYTHGNINNVKKRHASSYKQLNVTANRTSLLCRNRRGSNETEEAVYAVCLFSLVFINKIQLAQSGLLMKNIGQLFPLNDNKVVALV